MAIAALSATPLWAQTAPATASVDMVTLPERSIVAPAIECAALAGKGFSHVSEGPARIQSAAVEPATAQRAEFCLVKGYVAPTIQFELRLPTKTWTGGLDSARRFARMFLIPGVYHCAGGYVPYEEDMLGTMVSWVERDEAPDQVMATALLDGGTVRRRPVFAYPVQARYRGHGNVNDPAAFSARSPAAAPSDLYDWAGASPVR
jgi:hypothetical protein